MSAISPLWRNAVTTQGAAWQVVLTGLLVQGLGFANGLLLASGLGPVERGVLAEALLYPITVSAIVSSGLLQAVAFQSASSDGQSSTGAPLRALAILLLPSVLLLAAGLPLLLGQESLGLAVLYLAWMPLSGLSGIYAFRLLGLEDVSAYNLLRLLSVGFNLLAVAVLAATGALSAFNVVISYIGSEAMTAMTAYRLSHRHGPGGPPHAGQTAELLRYSARTAPGTVAQNVGERFDQIVLSQNLGPATLGNYVAGSTLASTAGVVGLSLADFALARVARRRPTKRRLVLALTATLGTGLLAAAALALCAGLLVDTLLGPAFDEAVAAIRVLGLHFALLSGSRVLAGVLKGYGRPGDASAVELGAVIVRVTALVALVPALGLIGAALALLVSSACTLVAYIALVTRAQSRY